MYSDEFSIGADKKATIIKIDTKIIFNIRIFLLIKFFIFSLTFTIFFTNKACAIISKIIKANKTNLLKNLYKSFSIFKPKKTECNIKNKA